MSLFWKKYKTEISLNTKDHKKFSHVYVEFEVKRNWYMLFHKPNFSSLQTAIQCWFSIWINLNWMYEGENPFRLIDTEKLRLVNSHINTFWNLDCQCEVREYQIRNIKITHLIR